MLQALEDIYHISLHPKYNMLHASEIQLLQETAHWPISIYFISPSKTLEHSNIPPLLDIKITS